MKENQLLLPLPNNNFPVCKKSVDPRGLEPLTCRMPCDRSAIELRAPIWGPRSAGWTWAELNRQSARCERAALTIKPQAQVITVITVITIITFISKNLGGFGQSCFGGSQNEGGYRLTVRLIPFYQLLDHGPLSGQRQHKLETCEHIKLQTHCHGR